MTAIRKDVAKVKQKVCTKAQFDAVMLDVSAGVAVYRSLSARKIRPENFWGMIATSEEARSKYARAKDIGLDRMAAEIIELSDESRIGKIVKDSAKDGITITSADAVDRAKLQVDTRKWLLSKLAPRKYGDKVQTEITGADGGPVVVTTDYNALRNSLKNRG